MGLGRPPLVPMGAAGQEHPGILTGAVTLSPRALTSTAGPPAQHRSPQGRRCSAGSGEGAHLAGVPPAQTNLQGFCSSHWGRAPAPRRVVLALSSGEAPSHSLARALAPPSPAPPPTKVTAARTPWGKCDSCSCQIQLSPQSHWVHAGCIGTLPHKGTVQGWGR